MLTERATPNGIFRPVFDAPTPTLERFEMHITTLNPGRSPHGPHCHPWEEILILKEGTLQVSINGVNRPAGAGAVIFFGANDAHTVVTTGDRAATYYVINFFTAAAHNVPAVPAAEWAPAHLQRSGILNWDDGRTQSGPHDSRRLFIDSPTATLTSLDIHASTVAARRFPVRQSDGRVLLIIVKEGAIECTINDVTHLVGASSLIYIVPGATYTLRNRADVPATYYVVGVSSEETPRQL